MPQYLSASALAELENCPHAFKLGRVDYVAPRGATSPAMSSGKMFEAVVMSELFETDTTSVVIDVLAKEPKSYEHSVAMEVGVQAAEVYIGSPRFEQLKPEIETPGGDYITDISGVPIRGLTDLELTGKRILDFKFMPGLRSRPSMPPGFNWRWDSEQGDLGPHARAGEPLEALNRAWATQLATYGLLTRATAMEHSIECVTWLGGRIQIAGYQEVLSAEWYSEVKERYREAWALIQSDEWPEPMVHKSRCIQYYQLCPAAPFCTEYVQIQDEGMGELLGLPPHGGES